MAATASLRIVAKQALLSKHETRYIVIQTQTTEENIIISARKLWKKNIIFPYTKEMLLI